MRFLLSAEAQLTKIPTLSRAKNFAKAQYANQRHGAIAGGDLFVINWQFLLQSRLSDCIEQ